MAQKKTVLELYFICYSNNFVFVTANSISHFGNSLLNQFVITKFV